MSLRPSSWALLGSVPLFCASIVLAAQESTGAAGLVVDNTSRIGRGTTDLTSQLALDAAPKEPLIETVRTDRALASWYKRKSELYEQYGFRFSLAYSALTQHADETRPGKEDYATGGVIDFGGTWEAYKRNSDWAGTLGFRIADQHRLGSKVAPSALGEEIGSAWGTSLAFDDVSLAVLEGWWEQRLGSKTTVRFGKLDASGLFDPPSLGNPFEHFMGQPFNLNNTIAFPAEGLGLIANYAPTDSLSFLAGVVDGNGDGKKWNFDTFFDEKEHLKLAELAWFPTSRFGTGEYHLTLWDSDERENGEVPAGQGYTLFAGQHVGNVIPFVRYGHSSGGAAALRNMVAAGIGFSQPFGRESDGIGVGASWGESFGENTRDQYGLEVYYRIQLTRELAVTPDVQYLIDPATNPSVDSTVVVSLRVRANL